MKPAKHRSSFLPLLVLGAAVVVFFSPHLFPPKMYVAGDLGGSDFTDLFWPLKSFLQQSLRAGKFPLWSKDVGSGFPVLGEGEIQLFSPTSILFLLLPLPLAFQLTLVLAFLINGMGVFFLARELGYRPTASLFAALAFTFAAPFVLGLEHLTIVTTAAGLPWAWRTVFRWAKKYRRRPTFLPEGLWLAIIVALQFFQASPQIVLLTLFSSAFLFVFLTWPGREKKPLLIDNRFLQVFGRSLLYLAIAAAFAVILASAQVFPSWEMRSRSNRAEAYTKNEIRKFSLTGKRLVNFIVPFALSNPSNPPAFFRFNEGPLLWETNGYVGLLPLFLAFAAIIIGRKRTEKALAWLALISLILAFGPRTPFGTVLRIFPFSAFRVPGRFLIVVDLSLALLAASFLSHHLLPTLNRHFPAKISSLVGPALILLLLLDLFRYGFAYNASVSAEKILNDPLTAQIIKKKPGRFLSLGSWYVYNLIYLEERGWRGRGDAYVPFQEALAPDTNLLYRVPGVSGYAGMKVKRSDELDALLQGYFLVDAENNTSRVNHQALENIFRLTATRYLISPFPQNLPYPPLAELAAPYHQSNLFLYRLPFKTPRAWLTDRARFVASENHLRQLLTAGVLARPEEIENIALVEQPLKKIFSACPRLSQTGPAAITPATITTDANGRTVLSVKAPHCGLLLLADTFYPGWTATIDGAPAPIFRANFNYRAVPVPKGRHQITFSYQPRSLTIGGRLSLLGWGAAALILFGKWQRRRFQKRPAERGLPTGPANP
jgi:hypothetical protein